MQGIEKNTKRTGKARNDMRIESHYCKYAINPSGDCWECSAYKLIDCSAQKYDLNPDGSVNIVECVAESEE